MDQILSKQKRFGTGFIHRLATIATIATKYYPLNTNPYQSPQLPKEKSVRVESAPVHLLHWLVVFAINLPVPLLIGFAFLSRRDWLEVAVALVIFLIAGAVANEQFPKTMRRIRKGGEILALLQALPAIQVATALFCVGILGLYDPLVRPSLSTAGAFVGASIMIAGLVWAAYMIGTWQLAKKGESQ